jgi:hypothetical protein
VVLPHGRLQQEAAAVSARLLAWVSRKRTTCMPIEFACPGCKVKQRAADHLAGRLLRCQSCGARFTVPAALPGASSPAPSSPARSKDEDSIFDVQTDSIFGEYEGKKKK